MSTKLTDVERKLWMLASAYDEKLGHVVIDQQAVRATDGVVIAEIKRAKSHGMQVTIPREDIRAMDTVYDQDASLIVKCIKKGKLRLTGFYANGEAQDHCCDTNGPVYPSAKACRLKLERQPETTYAPLCLNVERLHKLVDYLQDIGAEGVVFQVPDSVDKPVLWTSRVGEGETPEIVRGAIMQVDESERKHDDHKT